MPCNNIGGNHLTSRMRILSDLTTSPSMTKWLCPTSSRPSQTMMKKRRRSRRQFQNSDGQTHRFAHGACAKNLNCHALTGNSQSICARRGHHTSFHALQNKIRHIDQIMTAIACNNADLSEENSATSFFHSAASLASSSMRKGFPA